MSLLSTFLVVLEYLRISKIITNNTAKYPFRFQRNNIWNQDELDL